MRNSAIVFTIALLAVGCAARSTDDTATTCQLAANQVVIGERITFTGSDGKPVIPERGVYRVGVRDSRLALYFGRSRQPLLLKAETRKVALGSGHAALPEPRALLRVAPESPVRGIWYCDVDGTVHGSIGALKGVRLRGTLLESAPQVAPDPAYATTTDSSGAMQLALEMLPKILEPTPMQIFWDRFRGIDLRCEFPLYPPRSGADSSPQASIALVHHATSRCILHRYLDRGALENGSAPGLADLHHVEPGLYDLVVTDLTIGGRAVQQIRLVGASRTLATGGPGAISLVGSAKLGVLPYLTAVQGEHGTALVWNEGLNASSIWQWGSCRAIPAHVVSNVVIPDSLRATPFHDKEQRADAIAAGAAHWLAIRDGRLYAWGLNYDRQLGISDGLARESPQPVEGDYGTAVAIAAGDEFSLALTSTGRVYAWGAASSGQCGRRCPDSGYVAKALTVRRHDVEEPLSDIVAIAAGPRHALALDRNGGIWGWGKNDHGVLDATVPTGEARFGAVPLWVGFAKSHRVRQVMAIEGMSAALVETDEGALELYTWGYFGREIADLFGQDSKPQLYKKLKPNSLQFGPARDKLIVAGRAASWFDTRCYASGDSLGEIFQLGGLKVCAVGGARGFHVALAWEDDPNTGHQQVLLTTGDNKFAQLGGTTTELNAKWGSKTYDGETWFKLYFR